MAQDFIKLPDELRPHAEALAAWAASLDLDTTSRSAVNEAFRHVKGNIQEIIETRVREAKGGDKRLAIYSARCVLYRETGELVDVGPWEHGFKGLDAVWAYVLDVGAAVHAERGVTACPPEINLDDLKRRENGVRVTMSRKGNGVAAVRLKHTTLTGGMRLRPGDSPSAPEGWLLHVDVGTEANGRVLEAQEFASKSALCFKGE